MVPGPPQLGRGVVLDRGAAIPEAWTSAPVVAIDDAVLADPAATVDQLHDLWLGRVPFVVELAVDPARFRQPEIVDAPVWSLSPRLELPFDRLHFLVWANTYDARTGEPKWWWGAKAARLGAEERGPADVVLADGTPAWIDGGPRRSVPDLEGAVVVPSEHVDQGDLRPVQRRQLAEPELEPDQRDAVVNPSGAVRVIAPAGSGKTRVLTERVRHLLGAEGYHPGSVLAVAYNKKAEQELAVRLAGLSLRTRTLNALGLSVLSQHRGGGVELVDERTVRRICDDVFPIGRRKANTDPVGPYLEALTAVRLGLRDPAAVEAERDDVPGLADGFDDFRRKLTRSGGIDFDEQIYSAIEVLLRDGAYRRRVQPSHQHLLVDEFQDLTPAHVLLIRLLAAPRLDVFGVGDDDQTIYDHAGADPRFLIDFGRLFPGAAESALEINHRCPALVTEAVDLLLQRNKLRVAKVIRPSPTVRTDGGLRVEPHPDDEGASRVVDVVRQWLDQGVPADQIAVLTRVNSLLLAPQVALAEAGLDVTSTIGPEILDRTGVTAALAWLRIAVDPGALDAADLDIVSRRPSRGFPQWISKWFARVGSVHDLERVAERIDDSRVADKVVDLAADLKIISGRASRSTRAVLEAVRDQIGLGGAMQLLDRSKGGQSASHLDDLEALIEVADLHPDPAGFEAWLRSRLRRDDDRGVGITLASIHRVKGREWDCVVLFGMNRGVVPHRLADDRESERRVFHVGLTRCRTEVVVLASERAPSPFIAELTTPPGADQPEPAEEPIVIERPRANTGPPPVPPVVGAQLTVLGGYEGTIAELTDDGARLSLESGRSLFVRFGERVTVDGRPRVLGRPGPDPLAVNRAEAALRQWRTTRSKGDGVPAFVVLSDAHLVGIADRLPDSDVKLSQCPGIGPSKLERYGDEILEAVASALSP